MSTHKLFKKICECYEKLSHDFKFNINQSLISCFRHLKHNFDKQKLFFYSKNPICLLIFYQKLKSPKMTDPNAYRYTVSPKRLTLMHKSPITHWIVPILTHISHEPLPHPAIFKYLLC